MLAGSTSRTPEEPTGAEHKARWLMPGFFPTISSNIAVTVRRYTALSRTHPDTRSSGEDSS